MLAELFKERGAALQPPVDVAVVELSIAFIGGDQHRPRGGLPQRIIGNGRAKAGDRGVGEADRQVIIAYPEPGAGEPGLALVGDHGSIEQALRVGQRRRDR